MRDHPPAASEGVWQVMSQPTRRRGRLRSGGAGPSIASIIAGRDVNTLNSPSGGERRASGSEARRAGGTVPARRPEATREVLLRVPRSEVIWHETENAGA